MTAERVLAAAHDLHSRDGVVLGAELSRALGVSESTIGRWLLRLRREGRWPYPPIGPGKPARRLSTADSASPLTGFAKLKDLTWKSRDRFPTSVIPSRRVASLEEWRRRAWPFIFGISYRPDSSAPPVSSLAHAVRLDEAEDTDD